MIKFHALYEPVDTASICVAGNWAYGGYGNSPEEAIEHWKERVKSSTYNVVVWLIQDGQPMWIVQRVGSEEKEER